jgi:hypothetical protein
MQAQDRLIRLRHLCNRLLPASSTVQITPGNRLHGLQTPTWQHPDQMSLPGQTAMGHSAPTMNIEEPLETRMVFQWVQRLPSASWQEVCIQNATNRIVQPRHFPMVVAALCFGGINNTARSQFKAKWELISTFKTLCNLTSCPWRSPPGP